MSKPTYAELKAKCEQLEDFNREASDLIATLQSNLSRATLNGQTRTAAVLDALLERQRQQTDKGYSTEQDDTYICGELAAAAICYIEPMEATNYWPADWHDSSFKPSDYRRNLVKAIALLIAEVERFDRQEAAL
ncbi:hypothetical protein [Enterobacter hormaechei]|uniref:hypothetical protein n=1 Tax=Enterobacter hormaechei TaxID=158836 RepID=UPI0020759140|nr:hypothetical protein [Enterobacter hormaechei]MCM7810813.1 hypothetical protein [Enterobacter hormaechei]MDA4763465.1 hypothetical protein [Enterobacter hormaechei]